MVKADGCVAIHADGGAYKPLNWMNAPNTVSESVDDDGRRLDGPTNPRARRSPSPCDEVLTDSSHELGVDPGLWKDGVEAHLQELLAANCAAIAAGLRLVRREYPTDIGPGRPAVPRRRRARPWPSRSSAGARSTGSSS